MTSNLHNRKYSYSIMLGIFLSCVIFFVKCRTTYLLANPTIVLKDGWTVCEGRKTDEKLKQFNLMSFWPRIMNWLYINYQLDALIIIFFSPGATTPTGGCILRPSSGL